MTHESCKKKDSRIEQAFDVQGHRGCRGLMPENSIPAMKKALELGVTTLEMDVVISKDHKVLLSHEPFLSSEICLDKNKSIIPFDSSHSYNLYQMSYDEIREFDCGTNGNVRFPNQKKIKVSKPLLSEVIHELKSFGEKNHSKLSKLNIEIKSRPEWDGIFHPELNIYCDLVMEELSRNKIENYCTIQSFDPRVLRYFNERYPHIKLVYLLEDVLEWREAVEDLGFKPEIISPYFPLLSEQIVKSIHAEDMLVIPWTVNQKSDLINIIEMGVDGIISDYPDILIEELIRYE